MHADEDLKLSSEFARKQKKYPLNCITLTPDKCVWKASELRNIINPNRLNFNKSTA